MSKKEIKYEIIQPCEIISTSPAGWTKELNLIRWNDNPAKWDLRDWSPNHEKAGKGITLTDEEAIILTKALNREIQP